MPIAGHDVVITCATGASATPAVWDGVNSFSISDSDDLLETTDFADGNYRARMAALKDYNVALSGDLENSGTAIAHLRSSRSSGVPAALRIHIGGQSGASFGYMFLGLFDGLEINGEVAGKIEFSTNLQASTGTAPFTHV